MTEINLPAEPLEDLVSMMSMGTRAAADMPLQCAQTLSRIVCWQADWMTSLASLALTAIPAPTALIKSAAEHGVAELALLARGPCDEAHIID